MAAPTSPYATTGEVAAFVPAQIKHQDDFSAATSPQKNTVTTVISLVSSHIDIQFSQAGYILPFSEMTGESWPAHQTAYLKLLTIMGTVGMSGMVTKPAPALAPGRQGGTDNIFDQFFKAELKKIYDGSHTHLGFRAAHYIGSPAERKLSLPQGPTTEFLEGYFDPARYLPFVDMTNKMRAIEQTNLYLEVQWDYMYGLLNQGFGASIFEYEGYSWKGIS